VLGWDNSRAYKDVQAWLGAENPPTGIAGFPALKSSTQDYAKRLWQESVHGVAFHPYAQQKGITWEAGAKRHHSVSGRVIGKDSDCILIPIRNLRTNEVVAVQAINSQGKKQSFGPFKGHAFVCGNVLDKSLRWFVVEGWADAISLAFHEYKGNACAFAAGGIGNMKSVAQMVVEIYEPDLLILVEDAAA